MSKPVNMLNVCSDAQKAINYHTYVCTYICISINKGFVRGGGGGAPLGFRLPVYYFIKQGMTLPLQTF